MARIRESWTLIPSETSLRFADGILELGLCAITWCLYFRVSWWGGWIKAEIKLKKHFKANHLFVLKKW